MTHLLLLNRFSIKHYTQTGPYLVRDAYHTTFLHHAPNVFNFPTTAYARAVLLNIDDHDAVIPVVDALHAHTPFDAVATLAEEDVLLAAKLRERYGLRGMHYPVAVRFRDKVSMKDRLTERGVRVPQHADVQDLEGVLAFQAQHRRIILKPVDGAGTVMTFDVHTSTQARDIYHALTAIGRSFEMEEFIEGTMFHCDSIQQGGRTLLFNASQYLNSTLTCHQDGYLAAISVVDDALRARLQAFHTQVLDSLDATDGVYHLECFLNARDELVFCEVAARGGGAAVRPAIYHQFGADLSAAAIDTACGTPLPEYFARTDPTGWMILLKRPGVVTHVPAADASRPEWLVDVQWSLQLGQTLTAPRTSADGVAKFVWTGASQEELLARLHQTLLTHTFTVTEPTLTPQT